MRVGILVTFVSLRVFLGNIVHSTLSMVNFDSCQTSGRLFALEARFISLVRKRKGIIYSTVYSIQSYINYNCYFFICV